ncbi:MAG: N-acetyl-gamma-glutamyl-phosphate reductase [candidate division KSB1 bacterium]|nr:N-acetyl-gamma-glutamyl-phosphate reductase [candidate division KSB1 bacterium]
MSEVRVSIVGGSGYTGGELLRLLLFHPQVRIQQVTSERFVGKFTHKVHPNLRKATDLRFVQLAQLEPCDVLFLCLPHGRAMHLLPELQRKAERIIDLSADFRLNDPAQYAAWYGREHTHPEWLPQFVYGIPELHREAMRGARFISSAGCNATATILALFPLFKNDLVVVDRSVVEVKGGSSEGGNAPSEATHHPERSNVVRSYRPTQHRHTAEVEQELCIHGPVRVHLSATALDLVRGVLSTCHVFLKDDLDEKTIWKVYRETYADEPFIRIVKEKTGIYRYPEPKLLIGSNFCDIGFEKDARSRRLVVISAIDNLMKGAAGQAVQAFNLMHGFAETTALEFPGLHPV